MKDFQTVLVRLCVCIWGCHLSLYIPLNRTSVVLTFLLFEEYMTLFYSLATLRTPYRSNTRTRVINYSSVFSFPFFDRLWPFLLLFKDFETKRTKSIKEILPKCSDKHLKEGPLSVDIVDSSQEISKSPIKNRKKSAILKLVCFYYGTCL